MKSPTVFCCRMIWVQPPPPPPAATVIDLFLSRVKTGFFQKRYGLDQWAAAPLQRVANQWVAWGFRIHPDQFQTTFYLQAMIECRLCFQ